MKSIRLILTIVMLILALPLLPLDAAAPSSDDAPLYRVWAQALRGCGLLIFRRKAVQTNSGR